LLRDLKELAEYDQSTRTDRPIFLNDNEDHHQKFLCIHDDVDDLIESAHDSELLLIKSINSQRLDKKEQEIKNVDEQPAERRNLAPIQSTKEPEHLLSIGYEHLSITPETKSNEVTESNAENLLPIPSKCVVTLEDEIECDMPPKDVCSPVFTTFSNPLFKNDDLDSSDEDVPAEEFKIYSNPLFDEDEINSDKLDPHCFNVESDFVESLLNRDTFIDFSSKFDFSELNAKIADTIIESIPLLPIPVQDGNSQQEEIDIVTDDVLPPSDDNDDDSSDDLLLGEADLFLSDNLIPPDIENVADDLEGDIRFLEELLIDDFILSHESFESNFKDSPSILRPPLEPPDDNFDLEPEVISAVMKDIDEPNEHFNERFFLQTMKMSITFLSCLLSDSFFHISSFLRFLRYSSPQRVRTQSLILDYLPEIEVILCRIYVRFPRSSYPLIDFSLGRSISF
nr:hypothetical protein [Tanacetum cinerariifolium]